ncbi:hypothetical protein DI53_2730 [Sphingobacterium deserti]|uniref:Uncharacterized protein n=1 Tax=Sphingobacterium deserti TaxID=1229276 RepID=A0A0B8SZU7_9SPHI|nr:hypothetical protein DI53_2730 [Sphingobacterium deserti]
MIVLHILYGLIVGINVIQFYLFVKKRLRRKLLSQLQKNQ